MSEELGKIEKPAVEDFKKGRKLYFIPLIYSGLESPPDYLEKYNRYWQQVERQIDEMGAKLGRVARIYHELVSAAGEEGIEAIKRLNEKSHQVIKASVNSGATIEATEEDSILTEFLDWSRCLMSGLQNEQVAARIYDFYMEANRKRNECIARKIDESLQEDEIGIVFLRENHHVQFPPDIQVFYVAPPALDEIKRWLRDYENQPREDDHVEPDDPSTPAEPTP